MVKYFFNMLFWGADRSNVSYFFYINSNISSNIRNQNRKHGKWLKLVPFTLKSMIGICFGLCILLLGTFIHFRNIGNQNKTPENGKNSFQLVLINGRSVLAFEKHF